ncbi:MAG TPA: YdhR family protein [archaeon]|nr:YdhR family protein [archaeon]
MVIQFVKLRSGLSDAEVRQVMEDRTPEFRRVPGLLQKYFCRDSQTGEYAGVYLWDTAESMRQYRQSEFARSTPAAYKVEGQPRIEVLDVLFPLRSEEPAAAWAGAETGT